MSKGIGEQPVISATDSLIKRLASYTSGASLSPSCCGGCCSRQDAAWCGAAATVVGRTALQRAV